MRATHQVAARVRVPEHANGLILCSASPLHGIRIALKDNIDTAGARTTADQFVEAIREIQSAA